MPVTAEASVFISPEVTGLTDSAGKNRQRLEAPPGRVRRAAGNVNSLSLRHISCLHLYVSEEEKKERRESLEEQTWSVVKCVLYIHFHFLEAVEHSKN